MYRWHSHWRRTGRIRISRFSQRTDLCSQSTSQTTIRRSITLIDAATKRLVRARAGDICEYCHIAQSSELFRHHIEHIIPKQHHGTDHSDNLALACYYCNGHKGTNLTAYDPENGELQVLYHPRLHEWNTHFHVDAGIVIGLTAVGRATVQLFGMNDELRIDARIESSK